MTWFRAFIAWLKGTPVEAKPAPPIENVAPIPLRQYPEHLRLALNYVGRCEGKDDAWIVSLFKSTLYIASSSKTPWCAAFICWLLDQTGCRNNKSAGALAQCRVGVPCKDNEPGAIMVWEHIDGSLKGHFHVNILMTKIDAGHWTCVGGNQGDAVTIAVYSTDHYKLVASRMPVKK